MDPVLAVIASAQASDDADERLVLLLADFLGCVRASAGPPSAAFRDDGVAGTAALLALRASRDDRDDIDWASLHHPGAVVWPVVMALAAAHDAPGALVARAAAQGYLTAATAADLLGPAHRASWHSTATAGALAAAAAASVMLGADPVVRERALALAATTAGGLSRAVRERRGASSFNRAAAVGLGLTAARAAAAGAVAVDAPFSGPAGMLATMAPDAPAPHVVVVRDGLADAAPRFLPVSGFLQGAVIGAARARTVVPGDLVSVHLGLAPGADALVGDGDGGPWWDARVSVLRAWAAGSPFAADAPGPLDGRTDLVVLETADVPVGHARVRVTTDAGSCDLDVAPTTLADADGEAALTAKWSHVLGPDADDLDVVDLARAALDPAGHPGRLVAMVAP